MNLIYFTPNIYEEITKITQERKKAAICIITETKGSTPRKSGSKMIVFYDGTSIGSVGGGELEFFIVQKAKEIIELQVPQTFSYGLKQDFDMSCGGNVTLYIEPIKLPDQLVIFGAGHIGRTLAFFAKDFGFDITVIDEREGIFDQWDKNNFKLINKIYDEAYKELKFDYKTYICIMTYAHKYDKVIAGYCGAVDSAFVGVVASKNKAAKIRKDLVQEKVLTKDQAQRIEMPLGVPINCETPEEIAISILARLIDVKNSVIVQ